MDSSQKTHAVELQHYNQQIGYPPQYGYPPGYAPQRHQPERTTVVNVPMLATQATIVPANPRPNNYSGLSTATFMLCCFPLGLAAMVFSCMVDSSYDAGDYAGALRNSNIAKWLNVAAIVSGIIVIIAVPVFFALLSL